MLISLALVLVAAGCAGDDSDETAAGGNEADSATVDETQAAEAAETAPEDESALADDGDGASDQPASGEPGSDELCAAFVDLSTTTDATASLGVGSPDQAKETLEGFATALENLENVADEPQLAADAAIVSTPMQEIIALYEAANWDLEAVSADPEALATLSELSSPEVIAATDRITEVGQTRCGIDLAG